MLGAIAFVVQEQEEEDPEPIRFFAALSAMNEEDQETQTRYYPMTVVRAEPDLEEQMVAIAARELAAFGRGELAAGIDHQRQVGEAGVVAQPIDYVEAVAIGKAYIEHQ